MNTLNFEFDRKNKILRAARRAMIELNPVTPVSLREIVHELRDEIKIARAAGHRWEDIARVLQDAGCQNVKADTVRTYSKAEPSKRSKKIENAAKKKRKETPTIEAIERPVIIPTTPVQVTDQSVFENEVSNRQQGIIRPVKSSRVK